jgi:hypothetical protein
VEPFDQALSQRVQHLTEQYDNLTAQVIESRKTLPARRAAALQSRYDTVREDERSVEERRATLVEEFERQGVQGTGQDKRECLQWGRGGNIGARHSDPILVISHT